MIKLVDVKKKFGATWVTQGVNLTIPDNQTTLIIGRSGEGKSVLLKQIIGLLKPTSGEIFIDGVDVTKLSDEEAEKHYQKFGYVFQFAALLDSLTIFENVGITLLENGMPAEQALAIVKEKLALVNLNEDVLTKYPSELSGGMRKRAGFARTLITEPKVVLYDEPTTGLDPITGHVIRKLMYDMQKKLNLTSVVISHDTEMFDHADNVALLHQGVIRFYGPTKNIWESDNPYIYQFIRGLEDGPIQPEPAQKQK